MAPNSLFREQTTKVVLTAKMVGWIDLEILKPDQQVTILLASDYRVAVGYLNFEGEIEIESVLRDFEGSKDDVEFTHWMLLPWPPLLFRQIYESASPRVEPEQMVFWE